MALWGTVVASGQNGIITTVAGNGSSTSSGDGGPATSAGLPSPSGVAVDSSGNLYIVESLANILGRVRKVSASTGIVTTVAGGGSPSSGKGDGGPATNATLFGAGCVAVDGSGNLYIAEGEGERIRKVTASTGIITTVAGNGKPLYSGDGGPATDASLWFPQCVAVDNSGNIYIADSGNYRVRKVTASTGVITTLAGNGLPVSSGDGGPATSASIAYPRGWLLTLAGTSTYRTDTARSAR